MEIREIDEPAIGDEDVLLEVAAVGVCGSDLHQWTADHSWPVNYPVVLGHEFGGRIVRAGSAVTHWKEGDRVVSETAAIISADNPMSRRGLYNLDPTRKGFGYGVNGAMTKYVRVPSSMGRRAVKRADLPRRVQRVSAAVRAFSRRQKAHARSNSRSGPRSLRSAKSGWEEAWPSSGTIRWPPPRFWAARSRNSLQMNR